MLPQRLPTVTNTSVHTRETYICIKHTHTHTFLSKHRRHYCIWETDITAHTHTWIYRHRHVSCLFLRHISNQANLIKSWIKRHRQTYHWNTMRFFFTSEDNSHGLTKDISSHRLEICRYLLTEKWNSTLKHWFFYQ